MPGIESRDLSAPDEVRTPAKTLIELVNVAGGQIGRFTFEPGWRWLECIKPVVNTERSQSYMQSGALRTQDKDGNKIDIAAGSVLPHRPRPRRMKWWNAADGRR